MTIDPSCVYSYQSLSTQSQGHCRVAAAIVYYGTAALGGWSTHILFIESLIFGALISSMDPIAVLSVLSNMGMSDKDTKFLFHTRCVG